MCRAEGPKARQPRAGVSARARTLGDCRSPPLWKQKAPQAATQSSCSCAYLLDTTGIRSSSRKSGSDARRPVGEVAVGMGISCGGMEGGETGPLHLTGPRWSSRPPNGRSSGRPSRRHGVGRGRGPPPSRVTALGVQARDGRSRSGLRAGPAHAGGEQEPGAGDESGARAARHQGRVVARARGGEGRAVAALGGDGGVAGAGAGALA